MADRSRNDADERVTALAREFAKALLAGDELGADVVIRRAIEAELTQTEISEELIAPALWLIGDLWQRGEITVADEHLATEITLRVLALEQEARRVRDQRKGYRVLLATPAGEHHVVALRMLTGLLLNAGYETMMLGPDVPADSLAAAARRHGIDVVCLSVTMPGGADRALLTLYEVQQLVPSTGFVIGGRGLTSRLPVRPGIEVCRQVSEGVRAVDAIVNRAGLN
ncbi:B12-binding domain-containing protein [Solirubrobacter taibaiensis]|nr:B12-binding domain-containing protein [Solirubrobacter taibaiensis]